MLIEIQEQYHDYSPTRYHIDSDRLDGANPVEDAIQKALKKSRAKEINVEYMVPRGEDEPGVSASTRTRKKKDAIVERTVRLIINFDC